MRKRLYTALVPAELPCAPATSASAATPLPPPAAGDSDRLGTPEDDGTPIPVIHNIVSTAQIDSSRMPMDLQAISEVLPGSSYDRRKFAAMTIRLANPSCTLLLFSSGKLVVTGGKSWYEGVLSCLRVTRFLQETIPGVDFWLRSCDVQNIVAHVEIPVQPGVLDLDAMYTRLNLHCTYQKNMFPGLIYRPHASPVVLLCFYSGKIVITGGRTVRDVNEGWRRLWPTVRVFIKPDDPAPAPPVASAAAPPEAEPAPEPPKRVIFRPLLEHLERKRRLAEEAAAAEAAAEAAARVAKRGRPA